MNVLKHPTLSVIIPYYNREKWLPVTLNSFSNLQYPGNDVNFIFVDNGSTDNSSSIVENWISLEKPFWINVKHLFCNKKGAASARNTGLWACESEWTMFFDSDDEMKPSHIKDVIKSLRENPFSDLIYWNVELKDINNRVRRLGSHSNNLDIDVIFHAIWSTQRYAVRTELIKECGQWDERLPVWDDWELSVRLLLLGIKATKISSNSTVTVNSHAESITGVDFSSKHGEWEKSLSTARYHAISSGRADIAALIDLKNAVLAADYHIEGEALLAAQEMERLLRQSHLPAWILRTAFTWQKHLRHGVSYFALILKKLHSLA